MNPPVQNQNSNPETLGIDPQPLEFIPRDQGLANEALEAQEEVFASAYAEAVQTRLTKKQGIAAYDHANDKNVNQRRLQVFFFAVLPIGIFVYMILTWLGGDSKTLSQAMQIESNANKTATAVVRSGGTPAPLSPAPPAFFGGNIPGANGALIAQPRAAPSGPPSGGSSSIKCFAVVDDAAVIYPGAIIQNGGIFFVEKFTRSFGGLIFSNAFGWHRLAGFTCDPLELQTVETEFLMPTATATKRIYPSPTRTNSPVPFYVIQPFSTATPTLATGVISFSVVDCRASWLVWNVQKVELIEGNGKRIGVPGDLNGAPASRTIGNCFGTVSLAVIGQDGIEIRRDVVITK